MTRKKKRPTPKVSTAKPSNWEVVCYSDNGRVGARKEIHNLTRDDAEKVADAFFKTSECSSYELIQR